MRNRCCDWSTTWSTQTQRETGKRERRETLEAPHRCSASGAFSHRPVQVVAMVGEYIMQGRRRGGGAFLRDPAGHPGRGSSPLATSPPPPPLNRCPPACLPACLTSRLGRASRCQSAISSAFSMRPAAPTLPASCHSCRLSRLRLSLLSSAGIGFGSAPRFC